MDIALSVEDQVDKLIRQAMALENLCQCFAGWFVGFKCRAGSQLIVFSGVRSGRISTLCFCFEWRSELVSLFM
jgi:hypothetical protein